MHCDCWQTELGAPCSLFISMSDTLKWITQQVHSDVEVRKVFKDKWLLHTSRDTLVARVENNHKRAKQVPMEFEASKLPRRNHDSALWPTQGVQTSAKVTYGTRTKRCQK